MFVLDAAAALGDGAPDVLPGEIGERGGDQGVVDPGHCLPPVPSRLAGFGQAYPDLAGSVRVVVDLPQAVRRRRGLAAVGVEDLVVVGAVVDADAVVVDLLPFDGHQLDVVLAPQGHRDVSAHGDQCRPHLVRRQSAAGHHRVPQPVVLALLPPADDPLLQQVVQLGERPYRLAFGIPAALAGVGTRVAGHVLGEQRVDRGERALHMPFGRPVARRRRLQGNAQRPAGGDERGRDEHLALIDHDGPWGDDRARCGPFQAGVHAQQPLVGDH
ncbi:hypothetical protein QFZ43_008962 [Streptomyces afghaniensis]|nr:hypothetical protein [Streptomyces afghaniensis]MDQ1013561.1 hypothetical protein [Streptomyces afghaniensis]MDQ1022413.1 hypothetical protein [Streptomyces afghaniensis]